MALARANPCKGHPRALTGLCFQDTGNRTTRNAHVSG